MLSSLIVELLFNPQDTPITIKSLIENRFDLTHEPSPRFTMRQSSSYSPTSKTPGNEDWFANDDYGHYLRQEGNEYVMADLKGPGAVVRMWSANPMGTLRMYFDGESQPRVKVNMRDWVQNLQQQMGSIGPEFAFWAGPGWDVYVPMPYEKGVKITMEPGPKDNPKGLYYHVGYRTYAPATQVKTFQPSDLDANLMARPEPAANLHQAVTLTPGAKTTTVQFDGPGKIEDIHLNWNYGAKDLHKTLRSIWVTGTFDGEQTISAPLGDFLAAPFGHGSKDSMEVHLRFDMPFKKSASFTFERNTAFGGDSVLVEFSGESVRYAGNEAINLFHCDFSRDRGRTRPMRDMHWLDAKGTGYLVGCNLLMQNPRREWWGEGDEKIYVDGETFPSFFGTGSEDFLNYAWGSATPFWTPCGSQNYTTTTANSFGYCNISRLMTLDPIPFTKSIKFDVEMWHWADCVATWDRVVYWYAQPGATVVRQARPSWKDLELPDVEDIVHIPGAIEGEDLKYSATGGSSEVQGAFGDMSGRGQIWWMDAPEGAKLNVEVPAADGEYELTLGACFARDYGIHQLYWNGMKLGQPVDFYDDNLQWKQVKLGRVKVTGGKAVFTAECIGANPKAEPRKMFAVDYLLLKKVP
ncbi:MAG: DUF2961 domain-containing protein [Armatimonadetes bacterium]|nr:DUF2961 domain-containing protein [Armatimonadota bacterium]